MITEWQHRLLQIDYLPAGELARRFNLLNPRLHPESQKDATESSLEKVQWIDEVSLSTNGDGPPSLADNPDAVLFDGHERVEIVLARFGPDALVPVKWYQLSKEETDFALLVKDQTTGMAEYIPERLAELMERTKAMTAGEPRLAGMLEQLRLKAGVNGKGQAGNDAEPQIDKTAELKEKWGVEFGQLWQLGEHRLICGDCTDKATVERLMGGVEVVITDPPYKMNMGGGGIFKKSTANIKKRVENIIDFDPFSINHLVEIKYPSWYIFCNKDLIPNYLSLFKDWRFNIHTWCKTNPTPWTNETFLPDVEYIMYFSTVGRIWNNHLSPTEIYSKFFISPKLEGRKDIDGNDPHPTIKPLALIERYIKISSNLQGIVLDPFLGSGTTLIACENLNRRCRAIEIDPGYAAVSIQRWVDATGGLTPTLVSG